VILTESDSSIDKERKERVNLVFGGRFKWTDLQALINNSVERALIQSDLILVEASHIK